jgi:hypothetical protein
VGDGSSGDSGLVVCARALAGTVKLATASANTRTERSRDFNGLYSVARGCSIAGVWGAST